MITVENLSFTYRKSKRVVLHDFSLAFESGRVYGLLGKNGAGKSTLLYLMSGLLTPKGGKVMFHDTDVRRRLPVTLQDMFLVPVSPQQTLKISRLQNKHPVLHPRM